VTTRGTIILKSNEYKSYAWVSGVICTFQSSQFFDRLLLHFGVVDHIRASALTTADRRPPSSGEFVIFMLSIIIEKEDFEVNCLYKTRWDSYLGIG
jgi:hypothetical protein